MSALPKPFLTPEQYLQIEREAEFKSEYWSGQMFAMAGASPRHNTISSNVVREIGTQFKGRPCLAFVSDQRVRISDTGLFTYPDVVAVCGDLEFADDDQDTLINPTVIVEVLSPSPEAYDRGEKFAHYRRLASITDYVLISQDKIRVEHYVRQTDNHWLLSESSHLSDRVDLSSIDCRLPLSEIYDKVNFAPAARIELTEPTALP